MTQHIHFLALHSLASDVHIKQSLHVKWMKTCIHIIHTIPIIHSHVWPHWFLVHLNTSHCSQSVLSQFDELLFKPVLECVGSSPWPGL
jgi:hypothetical protein